MQNPSLHPPQTQLFLPPLPDHPPGPLLRKHIPLCLIFLLATLFLAITSRSTQCNVSRLMSSHWRKPRGPAAHAPCAHASVSGGVFGKREFRTRGRRWIRAVHLGFARALWVVHYRWKVDRSSVSFSNPLFLCCISLADVREIGVPSER